ncbi:MAG: hypothetical protein [Wendovervirus sonii]|uniref:Uncharacterized protein n=1 Tax=phage Lak_Megaphage_Sonny TaxID=3109229 RepID=A0ABZ0Z583_9CAUD|nr:MAG: hypothetical protein [phage Lak_Megaphage_Sonny]
MKKTNFIFENYDNEPDDSIVINITMLRKDAEGCGVVFDCNELRDIFAENDNVEVTGSSFTNENGDKQIYMYIKGMHKDEVSDILNDFIFDSLEDSEVDPMDFNNAEEYLVNPEDICEECENTNDLNENVIDDIPSEYNDEDYIVDCNKAIDIYISELKKNDIAFEKGLDFETAKDIAICILEDETNQDKVEHVAILLQSIYDEKINDLHDLSEKKKGCCPPKKVLNENIDIVLNDINKNNKLTAKVTNALNENKPYLHGNVKVNGKYFKDLSTIELASMKRSILIDKKALSESLSNSMDNTALYEHTKKELNLKNMLLNYIEEELTYRMTRNSCLKKLNEDGTISDEELANLFGPGQGEEAEDKKSDNEETDDKKSDNEDNKTDEKDSKETNSEDNKNEESSDNNSEDTDDENTEEIELSRIEITLKTPEACIDLKKACIDADIPESAIELEGVDDEAFEDNNENSEESETDNNEENSEENSESNEENSENKDEETNNDSKNESIHYSNIAKLFEDEETPANDENQSDEENANDEKSDDEEEKSDDNEEEKYKLILIDTDYTKNLADVLNDLYGISTEEFEEMIGGTIISNDNSDDNSENTEDNKEDNKEDKEDKEDDKKSDDDDDIDPAELFKGL